MNLWSIIFAFMKYSHALIFLSVWFPFRVVFTWHLLPEMKFHFWQNDCNEMTAAMSFILGYFMYAVIRVWPETELKIFHFGQNEISWKCLQYQKGKKHRQIKLHSLRIWTFEYGHLGSCYITPAPHKEVLTLKQNFQKHKGVVSLW